jgi:tetratricopeptide (TPR) repeat protein
VGSKILLFTLGSKILLFLLFRHKLLLAGTRENMAIIYEQEGHYDQALENYKPGLETKIHVCGQDSLDVAASYNGLGNVYRSLGKYQEALEMSRPAS